VPAGRLAAPDRGGDETEEDEAVMGMSPDGHVPNVGGGLGGDHGHHNAPVNAPAERAASARSLEPAGSGPAPSPSPVPAPFRSAAWTQGQMIHNA
jgi:hypothetical protein